jgi:hypothetical protein
MKEGLMLEEICTEIGVTRKTLYNWRDPRNGAYNQEFADAYEMGKTHQEAWWLRFGRANIVSGRKFNTPLFALYMANKFGWRGGANREDEALQEIRKIKEQMGIEDP